MKVTRKLIYQVLPTLAFKKLHNSEYQQKTCSQRYIMYFLTPLVIEGQKAGYFQDFACLTYFLSYKERGFHVRNKTCTYFFLKQMLSRLSFQLLMETCDESVIFQSPSWVLDLQLEKVKVWANLKHKERNKPLWKFNTGKGRSSA